MCPDKLVPIQGSILGMYGNKVWNMMLLLPVTPQYRCSQSMMMIPAKLSGGWIHTCGDGKAKFWLQLDGRKTVGHRHHSVGSCVRVTLNLHNTVDSAIIILVHDY